MFSQDQIENLVVHGKRLKAKPKLHWHSQRYQETGNVVIVVIL